MVLLWIKDDACSGEDARGERGGSCLKEEEGVEEEDSAVDDDVVSWKRLRTSVLLPRREVNRDSLRTMRSGEAGVVNDDDDDDDEDDDDGNKDVLSRKAESRSNSDTPLLAT